MCARFIFIILHLLYVMRLGIRLRSSEGMKVIKYVECVCVCDEWAKCMNSNRVDENVMPIEKKRAAHILEQDSVK